MEIHFHGAAKEVGRSCIEIRTANNNKFLMDVGVKFVPEGLSFPENVFNHENVDATFLSHAHLDHSGGLPLFEHEHLNGPIYTTRQTLAISKILLKDSYKIARIKNLHPEYDRSDLKKVSRDAEIIEFDTWYDKKDIKFKYLNAGHIPGSAMIQLEVEGQTILYTADFNTEESHLIEKATPEVDDVDILISESTYGNKTLPNRKEEKQRFIQAIKTTLRRGGNVLIPVFALGRAQEVLIMLAEEDFDVPIFLDGMCKRITRKIIDNGSEYVKNKNTLANMYHNIVELVSSKKRRIDSTKRQGIFVTTSGMLQGGPIMTYLEEMWHNEKNSILLTGFQAKGTNGRKLIEKGYVFLDKGKTHVKCQVEQFEFSGHSSGEDIKEFTKTIQPDHVMFQHGDEDAVENLHDWAENSLDAEVYSPETDQQYWF